MVVLNFDKPQQLYVSLGLIYEAFSVRDVDLAENK